MFRDRNLMLLAAGQLTSRLGDVSFHIGLLWLTLEFTGSKQMTGFMAMMEYLPILLFGLVAGVIVDRLDRRRVMFSTSLFRALLMLCIPIASWLGHLSIVICAASAFSLALATSLFTPARDAMLPRMVAKKDLVKANALVQGSDQFAWFLGPLMAAGFLALVRTEYLFLGSSLLFVMSFILLKLMRHTDIRTGDTMAPKPSAWREARAGLSLAWRHKGLRWLLILTAVNNFFIMGPAIVAMPVYIGSDLGLSGKYYGAIEAVLALGMMASSFLIVRRPVRRRMGRVWLWGMLLDGLTYAPIMLAPAFPRLVPLILMHALFIPLISIYRISIVQELVPEEMQGRVFSLVGMAVVGMTALSCGVTGMLLGHMPTHQLFGTWGILGSACGLAGWCIPRLRRL
ncbi:MAG: MFS transporter [bacterium]|nr:MFS transporter [bacterium]